MVLCDKREDFNVRSFLLLKSRLSLLEFHFWEGFVYQSVWISSRMKAWSECSNMFSSKDFLVTPTLLDAFTISNVSIIPTGSHARSLKLINLFKASFENSPFRSNYSDRKKRNNNIIRIQWLHILVTVTCKIKRLGLSRYQGCAYGKGLWTYCLIEGGFRNKTLPVNK